MHRRHRQSFLGMEMLPENFLLHQKYLHYKDCHLYRHHHQNHRRFHQQQEKLLVILDNHYQIHLPLMLLVQKKTLIH